MDAGPRCASTVPVLAPPIVARTSGAGEERVDDLLNAGGDFAKASIFEVAFVDPSVSDPDTILCNLRPGVEAIMLDGAAAPARQMVAALEGRGSLDAVHVIAHGAPGRVSFSGGEWTARTIEDDEADLAAIGRALGPDGGINLWSCEVGAGDAGADFLGALARAAGVPAAAATDRVGSQALGGNWQLDMRSGGVAAQPPLTEVGMGIYAAVLAVEVSIVGTVPAGADPSPVTYTIVDNDKKAIVGQVVLPNALKQATPVAMTVKVPDASGALEIGTFDAAGAFQPATNLTVKVPGKPTREPPAR
ncbi:DUF4347 domain-containing protein [Mesorhizobium sp. CU2]|uniref:DUF4347 domain-containing protein n=1 Tax=unclassified Mesorhizobium TaxID=325217 RepID=UPI00112A842F|nr:MULTISPECIES: DUF4347 domain-containing protein [unclassified Mesorhizobium]TPN80420.1 DUF4347 domain-containing protein [Mesorhizobium sp. CU3]TPO10583.1 DUF4347 domain-containing protein [Mesorhizobium sp. CU2]